MNLIYKIIVWGKNEIRFQFEFNISVENDKNRSVSDRTSLGTLLNIQSTLLL